MEKLYQFLTAIHPMPDEFWKHFASIVKHKEIKKGDFLLKSGQTCTTISFLSKGLVHLYFMEGDKKITNWFMQEGDVAIAAKSFFKQVKSDEAIQAIEPTEIFSITHEELYDIYIRFPEFNITRAMLSEKYYLLKDEHALQLQKSSARERYIWFMTTFPDLIVRVPLLYIASFLGITGETLSRIRSEKL